MNGNVSYWSDANIVGNTKVFTGLGEMAEMAETLRNESTFIVKHSP